MPDASAPIAAIIVNYAAASVIMEHIDKLLREFRDVDGAQIYIVDNKSPNDELGELKSFIETRGLQSQITLIDAGANVGFAAGNNLAFERAKAGGAEYVLFLNPDAYPLPGAVGALLECLEAHPDAAIAGARLEGRNGERNSCSFTFPSLLREFTNETEIAFLTRLAGCKRAADFAVDAPVETDWVSGTAFLLRVEAAAETLMDEGYFLYYEETDMMLEIKRRGWRIFHTPQARVVHLGGVSTGVQHDTPSARRLPAYWFDSWRYYYRKNYGGLYAYGAGLAKTLGVLTYAAKRMAKGKKSGKPQHYFEDVFTKCLLVAPMAREPRP